MPAEELAVDRADLLRVPLVGRLVEHIDGELHDVVDLARAREQHGLEVLADLAELADDVARADELTVLVECHLPGDEDRLAALHLDAVGVAGGLGEAGRVDEGHV